MEQKIILKNPYKNRVLIECPINKRIYVKSIAWRSIGNDAEIDINRASNDAEIAYDNKDNNLCAITLWNDSSGTFGEWSNFIVNTYNYYDSNDSTKLKGKNLLYRGFGDSDFDTETQKLIKKVVLVIDYFIM